MRLTARLLTFLNRVFVKDPLSFLALSIDYENGQMTWQVQDGILSTTVTGGIGSALSIDLSQYTLASLAYEIASQPGYTVSNLVGSASNGLSSLVLIDTSGNNAEDGAGDMYAYSNSLWAYLEANAAELQLAQTQIENLPDEMATTTADTIWLDLLGKYYDVPRYVGESDAVYGPRIIATVLRPANNNVAIEMAIEYYTGQTATVTDVVLKGVTGNVYNGEHIHDGSIFYNAASTNVYGLFDVTYGYDLSKGGDLTAFQQTVIALVNLLRAAGTHMRSIALTGSIFNDTLTPPTDLFIINTIGASFADALTPPVDAAPQMALAIPVPFADTLTAPTEAVAQAVSYNYQYNGIRYYDGTIEYMGGQVVNETYGS